MKSKPLFALFGLITLLLMSLFVKAADLSKPIVNENVVFDEVAGIVAIEAEHFYKQSSNKVRQWYRYSKDEWPKVGRDEDGPHCKNASNNAYIEILPDTRVTHGDKLMNDVNFCGTAGKMAVLHYKVNINSPGRYYVWVRAYSTGSEDNGMHVGIDGTWPETGQRLQWCAGKNKWTWESKQRTAKQHCGVPHQIYLDIEKPGVHDIQFSMREDGFEFDKFLMTKDLDYVPEDNKGPKVELKSGSLPPAFAVVDENPEAKKSYLFAIEKGIQGTNLLKATSFPIEGTNFYADKKWLAIDPSKHQEAETSMIYKGKDRTCNIVFLGVGEDDGCSEYSVLINNKVVGSYKAPYSKNSFEEAAKYCEVWENIAIKKDDKITVKSKIGSKDAHNSSRGRWAGIAITPTGTHKEIMKIIDGHGTQANVNDGAQSKLENVLPEVTGELKRWHKVTLTFDGPNVSEDAIPNPFMDFRFNVTFNHNASGKSYVVPGYYAADGNAGNTSAKKGNKWRVHFAPDEIGDWNYLVDFRVGRYSAVSDREKPGKSAGFMDTSKGTFSIAKTDKTGRDFRSNGRLEYVGERYLKFAGTGEYFLKAGSDAPENMLSYEEFDGTFHNDGHKDNFVKTWEAHEKHWNEGDPTWKDGKGKDIIGAVNYLASKGLNVFSFLTMNIGGDDQNVFPYVDYDTWDRMDCSKLDQWEILFEHADKLGMFLHFKTLEFENQGLLDNGGVGANTKLYYRELMARFGHHLALNWNICEESGDWTPNPKTPPQFKWQRRSMAAYFADHDPYKHHIVIHNGNPFYDLLGPDCALTGPSVQTNKADFSRVHGQVLHWINESKKAGKQWAVACDEPGDAQHSLLPDAENPEHDNARMNGLWGTFMAGGWGTEWYFGYKHAHSDLTCQDYASRDLFWDQCKIALDFFADNEIPYWEMECQDNLISGKDDYAFVKPGELYLFYAKKGTNTIDLSNAKGKFNVRWFNPRIGGELQKGSVNTIKAGKNVSLGKAPSEFEKDWVVVVTKK